MFCSLVVGDMSSGIASLYRILKDGTRCRIVLLLQERGSLSYVDLMKALEITNTGKMNYHLKVLGELLSKREDGEYVLSKKGLLASRLLLEFPNGGVTAAAGIPTGVGAAATLTLASSFVLGFFAVAVAAYSSSDWLGSSNFVSNTLFMSLMVFSLSVLALMSCIFPFLILRGSSVGYLWYVMIAVWIGLLAYSVVFHFPYWTTFYSSSPNTYSEMVIALVLLAPFIYSIGCIFYFLTEKPRRFFHIKES